MRHVDTKLVQKKAAFEALLSPSTDLSLGLAQSGISSDILDGLAQLLGGSSQDSVHPLDQSC